MSSKSKATKIFQSFAEKYPSYARQVTSYEYIEKNGIKFTLEDGRTCYYYPIEHINNIRPKDEFSN